MDKTFTAQFIASAIFGNCQKHLDGDRSQLDWKVEQNRLWKLAADKRIAADVMRLVCPSLGGRS